MIASSHRPITWPTVATTVRWAVAFAWLAALAYLLLALDVLGAGGLEADEGSASVVFVAAGCYAVGGLLIVLRRRWLWIAGAVMNALVLLMFFSVYAERPSILLSSGGLATKVPQILLALALLALAVRRR